MYCCHNIYQKTNNQDSNDNIFIKYGDYYREITLLIIFIVLCSFGIASLIVSKGLFNQQNVFELILLIYLITALIDYFLNSLIIFIIIWFKFYNLVQINLLDKFFMKKIIFSSILILPFVILGFFFKTYNYLFTLYIITNISISFFSNLCWFLYFCILLKKYVSN
jgi:hypothetical protein